MAPPELGETQMINVIKIENGVRLETSDYNDGVRLFYRSGRRVMEWTGRADETEFPDDFRFPVSWDSRCEVRQVCALLEHTGSTLSVADDDDLLEVIREHAERAEGAE